MSFINLEITGEKGRKVFISNQNTAGVFESRLFIGDAASQFTHATHRTLAGAQKWAAVAVNPLVGKVEQAAAQITKNPLCTAFYKACIRRKITALRANPTNRVCLQVLQDMQGIAEGLLQASQEVRHG